MIFLKFLLLGLYFSLVSGEESKFEAYPANPKPGDFVTIECVLIAPDGANFQEIIPDLKTDATGSQQFSFEDIQSEFNNDPRFHGFSIPDPDRLRLVGRISILNVTETDYNIIFTCFQSLTSSAPPSIIERSITLSKIEKVSSTHPPTATTCTPAIPATVTTTVTYYPNTRTTILTPTSNTAATPIHSTQTTPATNTVVPSTTFFGSICEQICPKQITITVAIMFVLFLIGQIPYCIAFRNRIKKFLTCLKGKFRRSESVEPKMQAGSRARTSSLSHPTISEEI